MGLPCEIALRAAVPFRAKTAHAHIHIFMCEILIYFIIKRVVNGFKISTHIDEIFRFTPAYTVVRFALDRYITVSIFAKLARICLKRTFEWFVNGEMFCKRSGFSMNNSTRHNAPITFRIVFLVYKLIRTRHRIIDCLDRIKYVQSHTKFNQYSTTTFG